MTFYIFCTRENKTVSREDAAGALKVVNWNLSLPGQEGSTDGASRKGSQRIFAKEWRKLKNK